MPLSAGPTVIVAACKYSITAVLFDQRIPKGDHELLADWDQQFRRCFHTNEHLTISILGILWPVSDSLGSSEYSELLSR